MGKNLDGLFGRPTEVSNTDGELDIRLSARELVQKIVDLGVTVQKDLLETSFNNKHVVNLEKVIQQALTNGWIEESEDLGRTFYAAVSDDEGNYIGLAAS